MRSPIRLVEDLMVLSKKRWSGNLMVRSLEDDQVAKLSHSNFGWVLDSMRPKVDSQERLCSLDRYLQMEMRAGYAHGIHGQLGLYA